MSTKQLSKRYRRPGFKNRSRYEEQGDRLKGYNLTLDYGLGPEQSNVDLDGCTVTGLRFEVKEGGTVVLDWLVQYAGEKLDSDVRGLLTGLTGEKIHIQLLPEPGMQVVRGKEKAAPVTSSEGMDECDGEDMFAGGGQPPDDEAGEPEDSPEAALMRAAEGTGA